LNSPTVLLRVRDCAHLPLAKAKAALAVYVAPALDENGEGDADEPTDRHLKREIDGVPFPPGTTITRDIAVRVRPARSQRGARQ
jgi:hypothetical protein